MADQTRASYRSIYKFWQLGHIELQRTTKYAHKHLSKISDILHYPIQLLRIQYICGSAHYVSQYYYVCTKKKVHHFKSTRLPLNALHWESALSANRLNILAILKK